MKNRRCRPGDLAIIVKTRPEYTHFIGRICTVIREPDESDVTMREWIIDVAGVKSWSPDGYFGADDYQLKPLRGLPDEQAEREREVVA